MDKSLVHTFSWGNQSFPLHWYWSMALPSFHQEFTEKKGNAKSPNSRE